jgi:hypothetical protein
MDRSNIISTQLPWALVLAATAVCLCAAEPPPDSTPGEGPAQEPAPDLIWQGAVGEGFSPHAQSLSLEAGASQGLAAFGTIQHHDLALVSLSYGHIVGRVRGRGHWYSGNWELRGELFGGSEFSPAREWVVGLTPHLRYDFATGTRWVPFLDIGAGVSGTGIGKPDLSIPFEFNLQGGLGVHWFLKNQVALTFEARLLHLSCAQISTPNLGVNTMLVTVGLSRFF